MAYELIAHDKFNQRYSGPAAVVEWQFSVPLPENIGASKVAEKLVDAHINALQDKGSELLELTVWEDASPMFETNYQVRAVVTDPSVEGVGTPFILLLPLIIKAVVVILAIVGIMYFISKTESIVKYIGDKAPESFALWGVAAIGIAVVAGIYLIRRMK